MTNATLKSLTLGDFGQTRRAWASRDTFGIHTGQGDPREIRQYVYRLQKAYQNADNVTQRLEIEKRVGRLMNGSVTVWIGALSEDEFERRNAMAYRAGRALRSALLEGVVPGGGASLLSCRAALEKDYRLATDPDHRAALRILLRALEEPFRVLMWNAGFDGGRIGTMLGKVRTNHVYDLLYQRYVNPYECGLFDSAGVIKSALHSAISSAALLLTTDVLVHLKNPPEQPHT